MEVTESNPHGRLASARLASFEAALGCRLPEDYRVFLLSHNGGRFGTAIFHINSAEGDSTIHHVYGLHDGPDHARLDWTWEAYRGRMPLQLLPVADDDFGNAICLGVAGLARGRVYFWDHDHEAAKGGDGYWGNVTEIAHSWSAFVGGLRASGL